MWNKIEGEPYLGSVIPILVICWAENVIDIRVAGIRIDWGDGGFLKWEYECIYRITREIVSFHTV